MYAHAHANLHICHHTKYHTPCTNIHTHKEIDKTLKYILVGHFNAKLYAKILHYAHISRS
jgi:hypothetical protein